MAIQNAVSNQFLTTTSTPAFVNVINGFTSTATAAGTTVLTATSTGIQEFTGSTTQTVTMPVVSTLPRTGVQYYIVNNSSGVVTVQSSGANTIQAMDANTSLLLTCILATGTTAASWNGTYFADSGLAGAVLLAPSGDQTIVNAHNLILSQGNFVVGSGGIPFAGTQIQCFAQGTSSSIASTTYWSASAGGVLSLAASASNTIGTLGAVSTGRILSQINTFGDDGVTGFVAAGAIQYNVSGAVSSGIVPSQMTIATANTSGTRVVGFTMSNAQVITLANPLPAGSGGTGLSSLGTGVATALAANVTGSGSIVLANGPTFITSTVTVPSITFSSTSGVIGTTTNDSAAAGSVGEFISSTVPTGAITLTDATATNITSISLTAGDWDVWGSVCWDLNASTVFNYLFGWSSSTSATLPAIPLTSSINFGTGGFTYSSGATSSMVIPMQRYSLSTTTTIYLSVLPHFSVGNILGYGTINARRRR